MSPSAPRHLSPSQRVNQTYTALNVIWPQLGARTITVFLQQLVVGQRQSGIAARDVHARVVASPIGRPDRHRIPYELGIRADARPGEMGTSGKET